MVAPEPSFLAAARWQRWSGVGGILFAVLTVLWFVLVDVPDVDASEQTLSTFYDDDGTRTKVILASFALALAGAALLWFLGTLRSALARAEGESARLATVAFGAGVVMAVLLFIKNVVIVAPALARDFEDTSLDASAVRLVGALVIPMLIQEGIAGGVMIGAASLVALRTQLFPSWFGWVGLAVAIALLVNVLLFTLPLLLVPAWAFVAGVLLLRATPRA